MAHSSEQLLDEKFTSVMLSFVKLQLLYDATPANSFATKAKSNAEQIVRSLAELRVEDTQGILATVHRIEPASLQVKPSSFVRRFLDHLHDQETESDMTIQVSKGKVIVALFSSLLACCIPVVAASPLAAVTTADQQLLPWEQQAVRRYVEDCDQIRLPSMEESSSTVSVVSVLGNWIDAESLDDLYIPLPVTASETVGVSCLLAAAQAVDEAPVSNAVGPVLMTAPSCMSPLPTNTSVGRSMTRGFTLKQNPPSQQIVSPTTTSRVTIAPLTTSSFLKEHTFKAQTRIQKLQDECKGLRAALCAFHTGTKPSVPALLLLMGLDFSCVCEADLQNKTNDAVTQVVTRYAAAHGKNVTAYDSTMQAQLEYDVMREQTAGSGGLRPVCLLWGFNYLCGSLSRLVKADAPPTDPTTMRHTAMVRRLVSSRQCMVLAVDLAEEPKNIQGLQASLKRGLPTRESSGDQIIRIECNGCRGEQDRIRSLISWLASSPPGLAQEVTVVLHAKADNDTKNQFRKLKDVYDVTENNCYTSWLHEAVYNCSEVRDKLRAVSVPLEAEQILEMIGKAGTLVHMLHISQKRK